MTLHEWIYTNVRYGDKLHSQPCNFGSQCIVIFAADVFLFLSHNRYLG